MTTYTSVTRDVYTRAALQPERGLCCTTSPVWELPDLRIPPKMLEMNYGCGTTVHPRDLGGSPAVLYAGVGGGLELLQFAYYSRRAGAVIGLDIVEEMIAACRENLREAAALNPWLLPEFVEVRHGDALALPIANETIDVAAQNCLFNIFHDADLERALREMYRVLKPHGRLVLSDPVTDGAIPAALRNDERLRALCLTGALPLERYIGLLADIGFGAIEVRARRPYRLLDTTHFAVENAVYIESVEVCAIKDAMPGDGPCVFTGKTAIYYGDEEFFDDRRGHVLFYNKPLAVCDKTAGALASLGRNDIFISGSTYFYDGGGCC